MNLIVFFLYLSFSIRYPGFLKLKMQSTYGAPVAFVDFQVSFCSFISCAAYIHWPVVKVIQKTSVWASLVLLLAIFNLHELSRKNISCNVQDVGSSTDALNSLQGTILHSSQSGEGMRVEYPLFSFTSFVFLDNFLDVWFYLTRTSDMLNRVWACGRSPIDNNENHSWHDAFELRFELFNICGYIGKVLVYFIHCKFISKLPFTAF